MKKILVALLLSIINCQLSIAQIGTWRNYLSYTEPTEIQEAGNYLFVLASGGLYQYNQKDQSIYTYDKVNGMSDVDISHIRWCQQAKRLVVVYTNSNIDLVDTKGNITNISDLYTKSIIGDKSISSIRIDGQYAYLICGFGIVKVNVQRAEITDTYMPNNPDYPTTLPAEDNSDYDEYIDLVKTLQPGGPKYNYYYFMRFHNGSLYTCGGQYEPLADMNRPGTIQVLSNGEWTIYQDQLETITNHKYIDIDCIDIDPNNSGHLFAGGRTGLYEFQNGRFVREYNYDNSALTPTLPDNKNYVIVNALKFDKESNLWLVQSLNNVNKLMVLHKDGTWEKKDYNLFNTYGSALGSQKILGNARHLYFDSNNYLWFVHDHYDTPALYGYNLIKNTSLEYIKFINQDGSELFVNGGVRCLAEDLDKNIWIGTTEGPLMLERKEINNGGSTFTQIKVPRNDGTNYADYLLANINITSMAIDGANRKWFGTKSNGVYLISADNMVQIQHFTTDNSPLLSNTVKSIAINPTNGEVFFGTDSGLCSFMSDATEPNEEMTKDNVWAYPNPVEPGYTGPITITGLTLDADIKILAANGALIAQGRSNGGTFTWDGCDQQGRRVASGVYMVATATSDGNKGTVCKIAIVR